MEQSATPGYSNEIDRKSAVSNCYGKDANIRIGGWCGGLRRCVVGAMGAVGCWGCVVGAWGGKGFMCGV